MAKLITLRRKNARDEESRYTVFCQKGMLYRREGEEIGEWKLYGGAILGMELSSKAGGGLEGVGKYAGKSAKEVAHEIEVGHALIVSPVSSPRAVQLKLRSEDTAHLSGIVEKIEEMPDVDDVARLL